MRGIPDLRLQWNTIVRAGVFIRVIGLKTTRCRLVGTLRTPLVLLLAASLLGCASSNVASFKTSADPHIEFPAPDQTTIHILAFRNNSYDPSLVTTLSERILIDEVEAGLRRAGFKISSSKHDRDVEFLVFCQWKTRVEVYDSYMLVPVPDVIFSRHHGRRGHHTHYATGFSTVVLPVRRSYTVGELDLAFVTVNPDLPLQASDRPMDEFAVWMGTSCAIGPDVVPDREWQTWETMAGWGYTEKWRARYLPHD